MIEYCLIVYLVCKDPICTLPESKKISADTSKIIWYSEYSYPSVTAYGNSFTSKNECEKSGKMLEERDKNLKHLRYGHTCFGVSVHRRYDCLGKEL